MSDLDQEFMGLAEEAEKEEREKAERKPFSGPGFEPIKWSGLEKNKMKIVRALSEHPDFNLAIPQRNRQAHDGRVVRIAKIITDQGKRMKLYLPLGDYQHLFWRIINKVNEGEWVEDVNKKRTKIFSNRERHPDVFNIVNFSNLPETDNRIKFGWEGYGWAGKEVFIMNVIDRAMKAFHEEKKHSVLLAKSVNYVKASDGSGKILEFAEDGIPAFGFTKLLQMNCFAHYGYWGNYDIGITRTGLTSPAYNVINATEHLKEVDKAMQSLVVTGPLTEEELAYERYDLDKIYGVTSYTKFYNSLKRSVMQIDSVLGTNFFDELKALADKEAEARKAATKEQIEAMPPIDQEEDEPSAPVEEAVPVRTFTPPSAPATPSIATFDNSREALPAWDKLNEAEKAMIKGAVNKGDGRWEIEYTEKVKRPARCQECGTVSPESFTVCPGCGMVYVF